MGLRHFAVLLPLSLFACSAEEMSTSTEDSNLDTSGCSGIDNVVQRGPVQVSASRPPTASCWNIDSSGFALQYSWSQSDNGVPQWKEIGFWMSVNGADAFVAADAHECHRASTFGPGHNTSGAQSFTCTAKKNVTFGANENLKAASYGENGKRLPWNVQVAVVRDNGSWDSLDGKNYQFEF